MSCLAAEFVEINSVYSSCSSFLVSVASATSLSKALIPFSKVFSSSDKVLMASVASSILMSKSEMLCSKTFFLSSVVSSCFSQYSTLWSSSCCSLAKVAMRLSIILKTLSKFTFLPDKAIAMKSKPLRGPLVLACGALRRMARAFAFCFWVLLATCIKLEVGSVFLNNSRASSSFRIFTVSAMAANSCVRSSEISFHSAALESQDFKVSSANFLSSIIAFSVSERSACMVVISTPALPTRTVLSSIAFVWAAISFCLASMSCS
mmetsp:Transcript_5141/g.11439  ORF Transcript_5141/g.11439 Transcript_5141/m.11439 type:complete len:263 (+) Transcript_5141:35-823(+)